MTQPQPAPAPAPAAAGGIPFVTDAVRLARVLFSPGAVFAEQQERPTFWRPFLIVMVVLAVLQFLQQPFQARIRELAIQAAGRQAPAGPGGPAAIVIGVVVGALILLIMVAISAGILYLLVTAFGGEASFKKMLTVTVFAWSIGVIQQLLTFVVLSMRGVDSIHNVWDAFVSFGADLLLPADASVGAFARIYLAGIGPLAIWQIAICAVGLQVLGKLGKGAAWGAAIIAYLVFLLIPSGLGAFGMKMAGG